MPPAKIRYLFTVPREFSPVSRRPLELFGLDKEESDESGLGDFVRPLTVWCRPRTVRCSNRDISEPKIGRVYDFGYGNLYYVEAIIRPIIGIDKFDQDTLVNIVPISREKFKERNKKGRAPYRPFHGVKLLPG